MILCLFGPGTLTLVSDGLIADKREQYGGSPELALPEFGYVTLGSTESEDGQNIRTESGFHGKLTRVQVWQRALDAATEIPRQVQSRPRSSMHALTINCAYDIRKTVPKILKNDFM